MAIEQLNVNPAIVSNSSQPDFEALAKISHLLDVVEFIDLVNEKFIDFHQVD